MTTAMVPTCTANRLLRPTGSLSASSKPRVVLAPATAVPSSKQHKLASQRGRRSCLRVNASQEAAETLQADSQSGAEVSQAGDVSTPAAEFDPYDKLNDWQMLRIVTQDMPDEEVNELVWECLGYVKSYEMDPETLTVEEVWDTSNVFPKWAARYPTPPDLLGVTRKYYPEIDAPIKEANSALARSIPMAHKQGLKEALAPLGWKGFKMAGLTPNKTRRAQVANWLVYYRKELRGVSLEELQRRKAARAAEEKTMAKEGPTGTTQQGVV